MLTIVQGFSCPMDLGCELLNVERRVQVHVDGKVSYVSLGDALRAKIGPKFNVFRDYVAKGVYFGH